MPENINVFAMNLGELEADVLRKLWIDFSEDTNGWPPNTAFTGRLTLTHVRRKINQSLAEIGALARSNKGWFILPSKANYGQYPVPYNVVDITSPIYWFTSATEYIELKVYDEQDFDLSMPMSGWRTETGSQPEYAYSGFTNKSQRYLGITPIPTGDATSITLNAAVLERSQLYGVTEAVSGSAASGSSATKMVDADGRNFQDLGVIPGVYILNITDGSSGAVSALSTTNTANDTIEVTALTGGSTNQFNPGDEWRIVHGTYGGIVEVGDIDATSLLAPNPGSIPSPLITMAEGNMLVRAVVLPAKLVDRNQLPELPFWYHTAVSTRAAGYLAKEYPADSPEFAQGASYIQQSGEMLASLKGDAESLYKTGPRQIQSKRK